MALQVQGSFELDNGITLTSAYARTDASLSLEGNVVYAQPTFWVDENAYNSGLDNIRFRSDELWMYPYDRAVDGADILTFANNKVEQTLEDLGYTVTVVEI